MRSLGTGGGKDSTADGMSANGHMFGMTTRSDGSRRAFSWTQATGMVDLGTLGGREALAFGVNNKGRIVGGSFTKDNADFHAFIWTAKDGIVDLNSRLRHSPAGLVLGVAYAISENGFIVASANTGLVLLVPEGAPGGTHTVGPITAAERVQVSRSFESSVSFSNGDTVAGHNVMWNWGDGSGDQQGNVRESNGAGVASASHAYSTPGIYTVSAKVADRSGTGPTASRTIVAYDPVAGTSAGSGWFVSPHGAQKLAGIRMGKAEFSFILPAVESAGATTVGPRLNFIAAGLSFRSGNFRRVAMQGARVQFEGRGTINGTGDYMFTLDTTAGTGAEREAGRFGLKIWHIDPATKVAVVDYDNQGAGPDGSGSTFRGEILVH